MESLGRFEILAELGRGGMGIVYKALDPRLDRVVAIKRLTRITDEHLERFRLEARAVGRLAHENITLIHEAGEEDGEPYLVMEYLTGHDLRHYIRRGLLSNVRDKVDIIRQVARGLDYAHRQGIAAHRDIKPANIQVTDELRAKIMDFGIAKLADEIKALASLTEANMVLGTLHYMSPEQIRGEKLDGRTDIWSAGVMLYELLYNTKPFDDEQDDEVMKKIVLEEPAPPPRIGVHYEDQLQRIVMNALEKDRERRYGTGAEMAEELGQYLRSIEGSSPNRILRSPPRTAAQIFREGCSLYAAARFAKAAQAFREVLELNPTDSGARANLQVCDLAQQRQHVQDLNRLGVILFKNREYAVAARILEDLLRLEPQHKEARTLITWSRRELQRSEETSSLDDVVAQVLDSLVSVEEETAAGVANELPSGELSDPARDARALAGQRREETEVDRRILLEEPRDRSTSRVYTWFRRLFARDGS